MTSMLLWLPKGCGPTMARLTPTRKIVTITLIMWKKGVNFDPQQLHRQSSESSVREQGFPVNEIGRVCFGTESASYTLASSEIWSVPPHRVKTARDAPRAPERHRPRASDSGLRPTMKRLGVAVHHNN